MSRKIILPIILILITALVNIAFTMLPLLNILSYESSALNGIVFSLVTGIYWLNCRFVNSKIKHFIFFTILSLIPLLILLFSTVFCQNCPINDGLSFYLILSGPSIFIGLAIAEFSKFITLKYQKITFGFIFLIILFSFIPELYFNPQIYFYNPIFGYYPGVIYDQNIEISNNLIFYRIITSVISLLVIFITSFKNSLTKVRQLFVITVVIISCLIFYFIKPSLGFATDLNKIKSELRGEIITEHCIILFPSNIPEEKKNRLILEHEYYYYEISRLLDTQLDEKTVSIIFESGAQKKRLFGAENADVTKPWLNHIYSDLDNYESTLKHELAHVFSAKFAEGLFSLPSNYNPGLIEGFAMAIENNYDDSDIDFLASLAHNNGYNISLENLFGNFSFFTNASSLSYIYAGSFLKYLADEYGWSKIKELYLTNDFETIYNTKLSELEENYLIDLSKLETTQNEHTANFYFGRVPLIKKYCARATAKEIRVAWEHYNNKEYNHSERLFSDIFSYSNSYSALLGLVSSKEKQNSYESAIEILEKEKIIFLGSAYYYSIEYLLARHYLLNGELYNSAKNLDSLIYQNPHQNYLSTAIALKSLLSFDENLSLAYIKHPENAIKILDNYFIDNFNEFVFQSYVGIMIKDKVDYAEIKDVINKIIVNKKLGSDTYSFLAKFAFRNLDFSFSIENLSKSIVDAEQYKLEIINSYLKKVNWCKENHSKKDYL